MASKKQSRGPGLLLRNAGIFNPVLVQAVGLCPVIAMATSLKGAALLALVATATISLCELIASMFLKVIPRWVRTGIYIILGGAIVTPFMILIEKLNPTLFGTLGIYLPVMAVNSLLVLRCERFAVKLNPIAALKDGLSASAGYAAVLILVGVVREILGSGSIAGFTFHSGRTLSGLILPFGGFLMLGFAAAALRMIISVYWPKFLDKKQPKPGAKKLRTGKPAAKLPVPELPDLTPEEDPYSLSAFSSDSSADYTDFGFDAYSKEKTVAPIIGSYGETVIEEPEYIPNSFARKLTSHEKQPDASECEIIDEPLPDYDEPRAAEPVDTNEIETDSEAVNDTQPEETESVEAVEVDSNTPEPSDSTEETSDTISSDEVDTAEEISPEPIRTIRLAPSAKAEIFNEVNDDELEMLLNRPVEKIFEKPGEDKK